MVRLRKNFVVENVLGVLLASLSSFVLFSCTPVAEIMKFVIKEKNVSSLQLKSRVPQTNTNTTDCALYAISFRGAGAEEFDDHGDSRYRYGLRMRTLDSGDSMDPGRGTKAPPASAALALIDGEWYLFADLSSSDTKDCKSDWVKFYDASPYVQKRVMCYMLMSFYRFRCLECIAQHGITASDYVDDAVVGSAIYQSTRKFVFQYFGISDEDFPVGRMHRWWTTSLGVHRSVLPPREHNIILSLKREVIMQETGRTPEELGLRGTSLRLQNLILSLQKENQGYLNDLNHF